MSDDQISVTIGSDISGLTAGLKTAATELGTFAAQTKTGFESVATADKVVVQSVQASTQENLKGFISMRTGGIFAFDALRAKVIETTAEVGRLRAEILETNDAAKLQQLQEQLRHAQAEMAAARTEMRALRLETVETNEKMSLFGEAVGVRVPGELGRLVSKFPAVQSAMAIAFEAGVVAFFMRAVGEAVNMVSELAEEIGGFGKEARKAYQEALDGNQKLILKNIELKEKLGEIATIGKEGAAKFAAEMQNSAEAAKREAAELARVSVEVEKTREEVEKLEKIKTLEPLAYLVGGLPELNQKLAETQARLKRLSEERDELAQKLQFDRPTTTRRREAEEGERERQEIEKTNEAKINAQREYAEALVAYEESEYRRRFALGEISLEQEISLLQDAERRKFAIEEAAFSQIRALKAREGAETGKNVAPELIALDEKITQSRVAMNQRLAELDQQRTLGTLQRDKQVADAEIDADQRITQSQLRREEESERFALANAHATRQAEEAAASLIRTETAMFESQFSAAQQKAEVLVKSLSAEQRPTAKFGTNEFAEQLKSIETLRPELYTQLLALNTQEIDLRSKLAEQVAKIEDDKFRKINEIQARAAETELALATTTSNRQLEASLKTDDERLAHHQLMLGKWQADELTALNNWYAAQLQALTRAEAAIAASFGKESQEYQKLKNKEIELDQQYQLKAQQIDNKIAQSWQQITTKMAQTFTSSVNSVLLGHEKIGQAAVKLGQQLELYIIDQGIKKVVTTYGTDLLQMLAAHSTFIAGIIGKQAAGSAVQIAQAKATQVGEVTANAGEAGAAGFASVMEALPFPVNIATAPGVAAAAAAQTMGYLAFEKGGIIPGLPGQPVAMVGHGTEMVLPGHISTGLDNLIAAGGLAKPIISPSAAAVMGGAGGPGGPGGPGGSAGSGSTTHNYKTLHNHIHNEIHNHGPQIDAEAITKVTKKAIRSGALRLLDHV